MKLLLYTARQALGYKVNVEVCHRRLTVWLERQTGKRGFKQKCSDGRASGSCGLREGSLPGNGRQGQSTGILQERRVVYWLSSPHPRLFPAPTFPSFPSALSQVCLWMSPEGSRGAGWRALNGAEEPRPCRPLAWRPSPPKDLAVPECPHPQPLLLLRPCLAPHAITKARG